MAKNSRGSSQGAQGGRRARGQEAKSRQQGGRKVTGRYDALPPKTRTVETDCIARGKHGPDCICRGTGKIRTVK